MTFAENAARLSGYCAWVLGWRPADFWNATPCELASILSAATIECGTPPVAADIQKLMELFPDG